MYKYPQTMHQGLDIEALHLVEQDTELVMNKHKINTFVFKICQ